LGYVILGLVSGLAAIERKGFLQAMLSRPIVLAPVTGWALGEPAAGLLLGPVLELLWLGAVNLGAAVPAHEALGTAAVVGSAVMAARALGVPVAAHPEIAALAVLLAVPAALLGRLGERAGEEWNARFASLADHELEVHHLRAVPLINLYGLVFSFVLSAVLAPLTAAVAAWVIPAVLRHEAGLLAFPLRVAFYVMGAIGCAAGAKALRARAAPLSFFGAAAATAALGLFGLLAGWAM
jgi:PTS system mannose-specific IIC component